MVRPGDKRPAPVTATGTKYFCVYVFIQLKILTRTPPQEQTTNPFTHLASAVARWARPTLKRQFLPSYLIIGFLGFSLFFALLPLSPPSNRRHRRRRRFSTALTTPISSSSSSSISVYLCLSPRSTVPQRPCRGRDNTTPLQLVCPKCRCPVYSFVFTCSRFLSCSRLRNQAAVSPRVVHIYSEDPPSYQLWISPPLLCSLCTVFPAMPLLRSQQPLPVVGFF